MEFTLHNVYRLTFEARDEWRNFLVALGMSSATINSIGMQWRDKPEDCLREGLEIWLRGDGRDWVFILDALSNPTVGHKALARKMREEVPGYSDALNSINKSKPEKLINPPKHKCHQWAKQHWIGLLITVGLITALVVISIILVVVLPVTLTTTSPSTKTTVPKSSGSAVFQLNIILCGVVAIVAFLF